MIIKMRWIQNIETPNMKQTKFYPQLLHEIRRAYRTTKKYVFTREDRKNKEREPKKEVSNCC